MVVDNKVTTPTTTTTATTTTTVPLSKAQAGWAVASSSARGVMVDYTDENVGGAVFRVLRLRARTTLLRWHVGSEDPPGGAGELPVDAGPSIDWASEGLAGVVAVFNGGFKKGADAGGAFADGVTLAPLVPGDMTLALSNEGHWSMGVWGTSGFPAPGFDAIAYRQNLGPLVVHGAPTPAVTSGDWEYWGSTWPPTAGAFTSRSGIGIDRNGNMPRRWPSGSACPRRNWRRRSSAREQCRRWNSTSIRSGRSWGHRARPCTRRVRCRCSWRTPNTIPRSTRRVGSETSLSHSPNLVRGRVSGRAQVYVAARRALRLSRCRSKETVVEPRQENPSTSPRQRPLLARTWRGSPKVNA